MATVSPIRGILGFWLDGPLDLALESRRVIEEITLQDSPKYVNAIGSRI
ncbi:hypothetical protein Isop_3250 [Isosphaera pallida ATCC 43644]|uniref:Uncharacterized protein n=1 Tax=Isosphaera pallida (strain ATCC 43644 / DSM 9630 / IS1B) TaxID=575540 RepID=E8R559_ISOPI|nr:hypothetical protein Isop_3250 [Isosphaera pallida ATCC 43644]